MRSKRIIRGSILAALALAGLLIQSAWAGNFHFNNVNFSIGSLVMQGDLLGLGNQAAEVTLTGYGTIQAMCENKGGNQAPGRNAIVVNSEQTISIVTDKNGFAEVQVAAPDPSFSQMTPSPSSKQAGCPNGKWTVVDFVEGSMDWTAARVVVKDESGQVQLDLSYTCTTAFDANGVSTSVACREN